MDTGYIPFAMSSHSAETTGTAARANQEASNNSNTETTGVVAFVSDGVGLSCGSSNSSCSGSSCSYIS